MLHRFALSAAALLACGASSSPNVVEDPDLVVMLRTSDSESFRWRIDAFPSLVAAGWRIQVYHVPTHPLAATTNGPLFSLNGDSWEGYRDRSSHFRRITQAMAR